MSNNKANKILYCFLIIGIAPLCAIFWIYLLNPESLLLSEIVTHTNNIPGIISSYSPLMTKAMDTYCKTAVVIAVIAFIFTMDSRYLPEKISKTTLTQTCILSPLVYAAFMYLTYFNSLDLATAGRPLRLIANNEFLLFLFYCGMYFVFLFLTYIILFVPIYLCRLIKNNR